MKPAPAEARLKWNDVRDSPLLRPALAAFAICATAFLASADSLKEKKEQLQKDLRDTDVVGDWIYDDIDGGFAQAVREKKPVCIVFR